MSYLYSKQIEKASLDEINVRKQDINNYNNSILMLILCLTVALSLNFLRDSSNPSQYVTFNIQDSTPYSKAISLCSRQWTMLQMNL